MSRNSTRKLLVLSAGFALLVVAALLTTHKTDSESSEPAVVATTTPPVAAHAPTTGTHSVAEAHKQDLESFIAQSTPSPCPAPVPKVIAEATCRDAIEAHAKRAGYGPEEVSAYLEAHRAP